MPANIQLLYLFCFIQNPIFSSWNLYRTLHYPSGGFGGRRLPPGSPSRRTRRESRLRRRRSSRPEAGREHPAGRRLRLIPLPVRVRNWALAPQLADGADHRWHPAAVRHQPRRRRPRQKPRRPDHQRHSGPEASHHGVGIVLRKRAKQFDPIVKELIKSEITQRSWRRNIWSTDKLAPHKFKS